MLAVMGHGSAEPTQRGPVEWLGEGACRSGRDMQKDVIEPPCRPPMPSFGAERERERVFAQAQAAPPRAARSEDTESSSGDEICFSGKPLLAYEQADSVPKANMPSLSTPLITEPSKEARLAAARARMQTLGCSKKERKDAQHRNLDRGYSEQDIEVPPGDGSGPDVSMLPASVFEKPKRVEDGMEAEAPHRNGDRQPMSAATSQSEGSEDESQEQHNQRSWWAQFFRLKLLQTPGAASLCVPLARMGLQDTDLPSVTASLDRLLEDLRGERLDTAESSESLHRPPVRALLEIDLSDNSISDPGAVFLFRWLLRRKEVRCRAIRLARNKLGDASMEWLAALICAQHSAIEEVHLSQNHITGSGAGQLLLALALHPFEAYPWLDKRGLFAPAWVSLDQNNVQESAGLLGRLRLRAGLRAVCTDGPQRKSSFNEAPHVQLGSNFLSSVASRSKPSVLPLALEKVCAGGSWPPLPETEKPLPYLPRTSSSQSFWMAPAQTFRRELLVDEEEGAGLHLETVSQGLKICEIGEVPGQPGLCTEDIIVAVDGLPLWWSACEHDPKAPRQADGESEKDAESDDDAPSARFRARFRRGARLDVFRQKAPEAAPVPMRQPVLGAHGSRRAARFCCPICWDSFDRWNDCLQHLRELGHEPEPPPDQRREEAAACLRRWMSTCMSAARGELPRPADVKVEAKRMPSVPNPEDKAETETLLLPAPIGFYGQRNRSVMEALAEEISRFGSEHGCAVWMLPDGLRAQCPQGPEAASKIASIAADLLEILHFYLPDVADNADDGAGFAPIPEGREYAVEWADDWASWLEQMLQQQAEEARGAEVAEMAEMAEVAAASLRAEALPFVPQQQAVDLAALRLLVLCGLPGSGKSTLAQRLGLGGNWVVVNQDSLGSRQACMKEARAALRRPNGRIVIDRCNVNVAQRAIWTQLAVQDFDLEPGQMGCVWLDVPDHECGRRVLRRFAHNTLPPHEASLKVIRGFAKKWQAPSAEEGFAHLWRIASEVDAEVFWSEMSAAGQLLTDSRGKELEKPEQVLGASPQSEFPAPLGPPPQREPSETEGAMDVDGKPGPHGGFQPEAAKMPAPAAPAPRLERERAAAAESLELGKTGSSGEASRDMSEPLPAEVANCASPISRTKEVVLEPAQLDSPGQGCGADFWRLPMGNDQELDAQGYSGAKAPEGDDATAGSAAPSALAASAAASAKASAAAAAAASAAAAAAEAAAAAAAGEAACAEAAEEAAPRGGGIDFWRLPFSGSGLEELSDDSTT
eukprot:s121_g34.t3